MKLFVTGGAGFIGSNVVQRAIEAGHGVTVFDNLSKGFRALIDPRAAFVEGDLADVEAVTAAVAGHDAVIHLAATSIIQETLDDPAATFRNNVTNGINLLEAMRHTGVSKIINSSTAAVYGEPQNIPVREIDPKHPITPYGASKRAFELALEAYHASYGLDAISLRYFNAYGPRDEQRPRTRAVPKWIEAVLQQKPVDVFWNGRQYRDYVYVGDIAEAHLRVLELEGLHIFNVGSANGVYMLDVLETMGRITGSRPVIRDLGERPGDPTRLVADTTRLFQTVGWRPATPLDIGLTKSVDYYRRSAMRGPHFNVIDGA
jgi:UDP-glucose 4-epimerase